MRRAGEILSELEVFGVRLGLESTQALLDGLERPDRDYPVVLVGGTNGKGSTSVVLASILGAAGYRVGLYTSPHLEEVEERLRVDGRTVAPAELAALLVEVVELGRRVLGHPPTYFEALTIAAYLHFSRRRVDVAVMEVGLGGRLDATNAAEPVISLITSISRDHTGVLGEQLEQIAREKAGIMRPGRTTYAWVEADEARVSLEAEARRVGALLVDARQRASWPSLQAGARLQRRRELALEANGKPYRLDTCLVGLYQLRNVALAVVAAQGLADAGWRVDDAAIEEGVRASRWPGRFELLELPDGSLALLDAAHNEEGMAWLDRQLAELSAAGDALPRRLVFGALDDKPAAEMLQRLAPHVEKVFVVAPASPRAVPPQDLVAALAPGVGTASASVAQALADALEQRPCTVIVCGSIYLLGDARKELRRLFGESVVPSTLSPVERTE
jgi:dihydrofolate synthase/folylpolyglutamate synthase